MTGDRDVQGPSAPLNRWLLHQGKVPLRCEACTSHPAITQLWASSWLNDDADVLSIRQMRSTSTFRAQEISSEQQAELGVPGECELVSNHFRQYCCCISVLPSFTHMNAVYLSVQSSNLWEVSVDGQLSERRCWRSGGVGIGMKK